MKKLTFILITLLITLSPIFSQLKVHDNLLGPSLGFWPSGSVPTFGANYENQLTQAGIGTISLGGVFRYTTFRNNFPDNDYYDYNYYTFGLQSNYNFNQIGDGKFVPFAGLVLGYNSVSYNRVTHSGIVYNVSYNSGFWIWAQFGARYFFSTNIAGSLRFGLGNFNFNTIELGVDFKF
jgi:hypothetical protein